jgi:hypothetical protein
MAWAKNVTKMCHKIKDWKLSLARDLGGSLAHSKQVPRDRMGLQQGQAGLKVRDAPTSESGGKKEGQAGEAGEM